jgi:hypothetical protein
MTVSEAFSPESAFRKRVHFDWEICGVCALFYNEFVPFLSKLRVFFHIKISKSDKKNQKKKFKLHRKKSKKTAQKAAPNSILFYAFLFWSSTPKITEISTKTAVFRPKLAKKRPKMAKMAPKCLIMAKMAAKSLKIGSWKNF